MAIALKKLTAGTAALALVAPFAMSIAQAEESGDPAPEPTADPSPEPTEAPAPAPSEDEGS